MGVPLPQPVGVPVVEEKVPLFTLHTFEGVSLPVGEEVMEAGERKGWGRLWWRGRRGATLSGWWWRRGCPCPSPRRCLWVLPEGVMEAVLEAVGELVREAGGGGESNGGEWGEALTATAITIPLVRLLQPE